MRTILVSFSLAAVLACAALATGTGAALAAAPRLIIVDGDSLPAPVRLSDWTANAEIVLEMENIFESTPRADPMPSQPRLDLLYYWVPDQDDLDRYTEADPAAARVPFYAALADYPALIGGHPASQRLLALLEHQGVPVVIDPTAPGYFPSPQLVVDPTSGPCEQGIDLKGRAFLPDGVYSVFVEAGQDTTEIARVTAEGGAFGAHVPGFPSPAYCDRGVLRIRIARFDPSGAAPALLPTLGFYRPDGILLPPSTGFGNSAARRQPAAPALLAGIGICIAITAGARLLSRGRPPGTGLEPPV